MELFVYEREGNRHCTSESAVAHDERFRDSRAVPRASKDGKQKQHGDEADCADQDIDKQSPGVIDGADSF